MKQPIEKREIATELKPKRFQLRSPLWSSRHRAIPAATVYECAVDFAEAALEFRLRPDIVEYL